MYVRFIINEKDITTINQIGIFQYIYYLINNNMLHSYDEDIANEVLLWFDDNLESPFEDLTLKKDSELICWFKENASDHIRKIRMLISILESNDIDVRMIKTKKPGKVFYSDKYQVLAKPYKDSI